MKIDKKEITPTFNNTPALPGKPMTLQSFKNWIKQAENTDTISIEEATLLWTKKKQPLLQAQ